MNLEGRRDESADRPLPNGSEAREKKDVSGGDQAANPADTPDAAPGAAAVTDAVTDATTQAHTPPPTPVTRTDRIEVLDLLRGFAVLGILLVNIWAYGLPFPASLNPRLVGFDTFGDRIVHGFVYMVALTKTMPIFSMLFGAGIVLFAQRLEARGRKPAGFFVRRQLWLLVFGLVHAYLLWNGDILVPYAVIGLILYRLRRRRPRTLLILAVLVILVGKGAAQLGGFFMEKMQVEGQAAEVALAAGEELDEGQERMLEMWRKQDPDQQWNPSAEEIDELKATMHGGYLEILTHHAPETAAMHFTMYPALVGWNIAGYMLLGMMLFKMGVLIGERSAGFYVRMAAICYGIGVPLALYGLWFFDTHTESFVPIMTIGIPIVDISGPLVALGHIALLNLVWRRGWRGDFATRLRAAGRMAFTNYIAQTLICTTLFHGWGFGLWGALNRLELLGVVVAIWALQLWWSPVWLSRYRFGPLEWVWRSLTYRSRQPMRLPAVAE